MRTRHRIEAQLVAVLPGTLAALLGAAYGYLVRPRRSFSQFGEDLIVASFFEEVGVRRGRYVDIGAFHPRWLSNSHLLATKGWSGVVVDVDHKKVRLCTMARRRCSGITAAVAPAGSPSHVSLYSFQRLWSEIDTLSREDAEECRRRLGIPFHAVEIPSIGVNEVLSVSCGERGRVDFLNIDLEGIDEEILGEIDFDRFEVGLICFENNDVFGGTSASIAMLKARGYRHLATAGGSHLYVRADLAESPRTWRRSAT